MIECPLIPYGYDKNKDEEDNRLNSQRFYNDFYEEIQDKIKIKELFKYFHNYKMDNKELEYFEMGKSRIIMTDYKKELEIEQTPAYLKIYSLNILLIIVLMTIFLKY